MLLWKGKVPRELPKNYRGISLLSIASRIVARICAQRLTSFAETMELLEPEQWTFRQYRRTIDAAMLARALVEEAARSRSQLSEQSICLLLVDLEKAYPSVPREARWRLLKLLGVPACMLARLSGLHGCTSYVVRLATGDSDPYSM